MVSFWPWKGEDSSPSSFEKTLSTLSKKIAGTQLQIDKLRTSSRRVKVLWTLYLTFAYLVYAIVLVLVVGWKSLGPWEWSGLAGSPVLIYLIRTTTTAYFAFRIDSLESRLKEQQAERAKTIQKLKDATRYDSTLELLEKYGGEKPKPKRAKSGQTGEGSDGASPKADQGKKGGRQSVGAGPQGPTGRTNMPPPATANIQRPVSTPGTPQNQAREGALARPLKPSSPLQHDVTAEFAPNADNLPSGGTQYESHHGSPHWYDRILDLMLGEDETAPKNRIVLICQKCRLVNGQAPPGTKTLAEVGRWKCISCGHLNGELDEGKKIMQEVLGRGSRSGVEARGSGELHGDLGSAAEDEDEETTESSAEQEDGPNEPKPPVRTGRNKPQATR